MLHPFKDEFSQEIWDLTYRHHLDKTPQDTFRRVSKALASVEGVDRDYWEEEFFKLLENFDATTGGRIYTNAGTEFGGSTLINCFPAGHFVSTIDGPKAIEDVEIGDLVLTHKGHYRKVVNAFSREVSEKIDVYDSTSLVSPIRVTKEHPFFQPDGSWVESKDNDTLVYGFLDDCGKDNITIDVFDELDGLVENLICEEDSIYTKTEFIGGQGAKGEKVSHGINRKIVVDEEFAYFLGRFTGDGSTFSQNNKACVEGFNLVFSTTEMDALDRIKNIISNYFGLEVNVNEGSGNYVYLRKFSVVVSNLLRKLVGSNSSTKHIPQVIWRSNRSVRLAYLQGLIDADACFTKNHLTQLTLNNKSLVYEVSIMLSELGCPNKVYETDHNYLKKTYYQVKLNKEHSSTFIENTMKVYDDDRLNNYSFDGRYSRTKISKAANTFYFDIWVNGSKREEFFDGRVYNISVEEDESYVVNGVIVHNCFVQPQVDNPPDSIAGIYEALLDQAKTLKSEGGWGHNFSALRPRGSFIHGVGVESPGAVSFMELFDKSSAIVTSGSGVKSKNKKAKKKIRKGAMMAVLDVWHPDIIEFVRAKQTPGRLTKFNISVNATDKFMNSVIRSKESGVDEEWELIFPDTTHEQYNLEWKGDIEDWKAKGYPVVVYNTISVLTLWNMIMESTYNRAEPGILFLDRANDYYSFNYGNKLVATNPCLTGDTLTATERGYVPLKDVKVGDMIQTVDGLRPVAEVEVHENTPVFEVELSDGTTLKATAAHIFHVGREKFFDTETRLDQLKVGDHVRLSPATLAVESDVVTPEGVGQRDYGLLIGALIGDGSYTETSKTVKYIGSKNERDWLDILAQKAEIVGPIQPISKCTGSTIQFCTTPLMKFLDSQGELERGKSPQKSLPLSMLNSNKEFLAGYIDGLISTDGNIHISKSNPMVRVTSSNKESLMMLKRALSYFGILARVYPEKSKIRGSKNIIEGREVTRTSDGYVLVILGENIKKLYQNVGITHPQKKERLLNLVINYNLTGCMWKAEIKSITPLGNETVYDLFEEVTDTWVTEGVVSRGCGEQVLPPAGSCDLGSVNLTRFVREDGSFDYGAFVYAAKTLVRLLDNVNSYTNLPLPEYEKYVREKRRIGCGVLGWGSALYMMKIRFGSEEANALRDKIMKMYAIACHEASIDLAIEKGMFEGCDPIKHSETKYIKSLGLSEEYMRKLRKFGIRNSALMSCQPTGNTSIYANVVSGGIEPVFAQEYIRTVIVSPVPDHLQAVTPKFWEGVMEETEFFKWAKEGDESILRGVDADGTVYKIDVNRGLTKEVDCMDYGVRWLKDRGGWDANADWAVTAMSLTPEIHVNDLTGFARWVDSSISKTVNVPYEYPFDEFENVYLQAYSEGFVKGVTTYRSGTMTTVLAEKPKANEPEEEIILADVKLPVSSPATMKVLKAEGRKWYLTVLHGDDSKPFALFVHTNSNEKSIHTNDALDILFKLARDKGIPEHHIETTEKKMSGDSNSSKLARAISLLLRHGVLPKNIVFALEQVDDVFVGSFLFQIRKFLSSYVKDGERVEGAKCEVCGSDHIVFSEGCSKCMACGSSRCG
jgi:ribonucleoside-diphosphate reductase alpha chain